ncbi:nucleoside phosphorylase [Streptococcus mutans]|jgi:purine-nucleoside phosphorylase|uniref:nucleoside phosphorylase n=1 Tax=Streptococcus mutans TaxID=1309 RepID=UPI0002B5C07A|nr:nucleoside phosphorylase [Streptococcus mutans]EMB85996.1 putative purine-nucleoside phosphorylase [Streptococcus mutans NVAB]EMB91314.1 putative purine-nucleoside phosphorylase [Streptococcus mutans A19]EMB95591.1 putative purine-nucleoside phosphorylase [Streptococcus mutans U138]EMP63167.1 putative purine-nucleoside phosphorylase [Streptococcus mutans ATCC 25175]MCB5113165.1 nucleoside phosphorylase [Streptococcus mutans]
MILSNFDDAKKAIINPEDLVAAITDFPEIVVSCFARATFKRMLKRYKYRLLTKTSVANLDIPIYELDYHGRKLAVLEDLVAMGMKKLILFGTCGILEEQVKETSIIVPTIAVRDEGTSFHYAPAQNEISANDRTLAKFLTYLQAENISFSKGKVWTTDGIYREMITKMKARKQEGCLAVDMECSAVAAWGQFREIAVCQFFYAADHLSEERWHPRSLGNEADLDEKDKIAEIALNFSTYL